MLEFRFVASNIVFPFVNVTAFFSKYIDLSKRKESLMLLITESECGTGEHLHSAVQSAETGKQLLSLALFFCPLMQPLPGACRHVVGSAWPVSAKQLTWIVEEMKRTENLTFEGRKRWGQRLPELGGGHVRGSNDRSN